MTIADDRQICGVCNKVFYHRKFVCSNGQVACSEEHKKEIENKIRGDLGE